MSDLKSALTPEEWSLEAFEMGLNKQKVAIDASGGLDVPATSYYYGAYFDTTELRAKLAALALHEQPFGFTWEDVELLQARAELTANPTESAWCISLANRIASLLPPRGIKP